MLKFFKITPEVFKVKEFFKKYRDLLERQQEDEINNEIYHEKDEIDNEIDNEKEISIIEP